MNWSTAFLKQAESDLGAAKELQNRNECASQCLWFCQQAAEKALKGFILRFSKTDVENILLHSIVSLKDKIKRTELKKLNKSLGPGNLNQIEKFFDPLVPPKKFNRTRKNIRYPFESNSGVAAPCDFEEYKDPGSIAEAVRLAKKMVMAARYGNA